MTHHLFLERSISSLIFQDHRETNIKIIDANVSQFLNILIDNAIINFND